MNPIIIPTSYSSDVDLASFSVFQFIVAISIIIYAIQFAAVLLLFFYNMFENKKSLAFWLVPIFPIVYTLINKIRSL